MAEVAYESAEALITVIESYRSELSWMTKKVLDEIKTRIKNGYTVDSYDMKQLMAGFAKDVPNIS